MFDEVRRRRAARRLRAGDGRPLKPFRWWQLLQGRKLFSLRLEGEDGREVVYALDVRHGGKEGGDFGTAHLYRDGGHHAESTLPAVFPVEGGTIEAAMSTAGLRRAHYVTPDGAEEQLAPDPRSAEGRRLRFDREHPTVSRWIGAISVVVLVIGLGVNLVQIAEQISDIPPLVERFGRFESPIRLPLWLNITLGIAAGAAGRERALRLKYHWLLD